MAVAAHKIGNKFWRADSDVFTEFSDVITLFEAEYGTTLGGRIDLGPGIFNITPATMASDNLEIVGAGPSTVLLLDRATYTTETGITLNGARCLFKNLRMSGGLSAVTTPSDAKFVAVNGNDNRFENIWVDNMNGYWLEFDGVWHGSVLGCRVQNADGYQCLQRIISCAAAHRVIIDGNIFDIPYDVTNAQDHLWAIYLSGSEYMSVTNNVLLCDLGPISNDWVPVTGYFNQCIIAGNKIIARQGTNDTDQALIDTTGDENIIIENSLDGNFPTGVTCRNGIRVRGSGKANIVASNVNKGMTDSGVQLESTGNISAYNLALPFGNDEIDDIPGTNLVRVITYP